MKYTIILVLTKSLIGGSYEEDGRCFKKRRYEREGTYGGLLSYRYN